ncbi:MAG: PAS domain-containing protein [Deltaproteobacteria bacterium]|nr:PAS domain-containing protein [Deltaproteobacteria bacterium]
MHWRNSVFFPIVLFSLLTVVGFLGLVVYYASSVPLRSPSLWYGSLFLELGAVVGALTFGKHLQARLRELGTFLATTAERDVPPSLPVQNEDEVGALERGVQHAVARQHERLRALAAERKKLEAVLQSMAEGVVVIDPTGHVVLCNPAAQELFSFRPGQDWQGKPIQAFSRHPLLQELLREVADRQPGDAPVSRELQLESTEGRYLAASAMQIYEDGITASGYVLVFYDLTQIKRLESVRADFVANVSHELRTPLTAIKGYAETLLNGAIKDAATAQRFLEIIDRHSERLSRLIDDLLTLSNLELGKAEFHKENIVLIDVVNEVFEVVREKATGAGITLIRQCPLELPSLTGDSDRLQQVLVNLIDNAIKYTPANGTVTVAARVVRDPELGVQAYNGAPSGTIPPREWMEVSVTDTGSGIPEEDLPRLTQRFYRVDKARSRELGGTGLGLAIVKHIVQAHHGVLRITSQLKQGTTVRMFLPL